MEGKLTQSNLNSNQNQNQNIEDFDNNLNDFSFDISFDINIKESELKDEEIFMGDYEIEKEYQNQNVLNTNIISDSNNTNKDAITNTLNTNNNINS
jgi:hypothetical protein